MKSSPKIQARQTLAPKTKRDCKAVALSDKNTRQFDA